MNIKSRTCICIIQLRDKRFVMAGDRRDSAHWGYAFKCPMPKIRKKDNGMLIGASGNSGLCKLVVDVFEPPEIEYNDLDRYMFFNFQTALVKLLKQQAGYSDSHKNLTLPYTTDCGMLIAFLNKIYTVDIINQYEEGAPIHGGEIVISDVPAPFGIGCGSPSALPILMEEKKLKGYNTIDTLKKAMEVAADMSPGCDNSIDLIGE